MGPPVPQEQMAARSRSGNLALGGLVHIARRVDQACVVIYVFHAGFVELEVGFTGGEEVLESGGVGFADGSHERGRACRRRGVSILGTDFRAV